ncbi:jg21413 [Pararge aegeria aegeria]|uniref:Jg21413 protein n=1 Tax=Pararge aegeria aegeria TaxID=348720 RepID=A0A8S4QNK1_9NEOP|nr:jg21413 [Pararge aegeria aegeria]
MALADTNLNLEAFLNDLQKNNAGYLNRFRTARPSRVFTDSQQSKAPAEPITIDEDPVAIPQIVIESSTSPASSEADDGFTVVVRFSAPLPRSAPVARQPKASKSKANPPKKVVIDRPARTKSQAPRTASQASLANVSEPEDSPMEEQLQPRDRIPPLFIRDKLAWMKIIPLLEANGIGFTGARSTAIGIRVQCLSSDDHRRLTDYTQRAQHRCVKCLGDHGTADCSRRDPTVHEPQSCVLCYTQEHPANYPSSGVHRGYARMQTVQNEENHQGKLHNADVLGQMNLCALDWFVWRRRTKLLNKAPLTRAIRTLNDIAERTDLICCTLIELTKVALCIAKPQMRGLLLPVEEFCPLSPTTFRSTQNLGRIIT